VTPSLAVVIVTFNNADSIARCVARARELNADCDVVVVDHGTDGAGDIAATAGARVFRNPWNPGFGAGQNQGVRETHAPFILLLNPDAEPDREGIRAGLAILETNPHVGALQGVIVNRASGRPERSRGRELGPIHLFGRALGARRLLTARLARAVARRFRALADHVDRVPSSPEPVASLAATAVIVRREAFETVGGFDESYFLYGEDLDLCRRLRDRGWTLLALPERFAVHEGGGSATTPVDRELTWWRGTMRFAALWWSPVDWCAGLGAAFLLWCRVSLRSPRIASRAWSQLLAAPIRDRQHVRRSALDRGRARCRTASCAATTGGGGGSHRG